jgi:hypothetical protein
MYVLILEAKLGFWSKYGAPNGSEIWDPKTGSKTGLPPSVTRADTNTTACTERDREA